MTSPSRLDRRLRPSRTEHGARYLRLLAAQVWDEARSVRIGLVVDLGCGSKPYRTLFAGPYLGLDLTSLHGRPDALGTAEQTPFASECADTVLSTQQLEHVSDPRLVLREARRLLKPGGTLLLSTHGVWPYHPDPADRWRWTEEGLRAEVALSGLEVERVHRQGEFLSAAVMLATYPVGGARRKGQVFVRAAAGSLLYVTNLLCAVLDRASDIIGLRHYASAGYLVVASRPENDRTIPGSDDLQTARPLRGDA